MTKTKGKDIESIETIGEPYKKGFVIRVNFKDGHYLLATDPARISMGTQEPEPEPVPEEQPPKSTAASRLSRNR